MQLHPVYVDNSFFGTQYKCHKTSYKTFLQLFVDNSRFFVNLFESFFTLFNRIFIYFRLQTEISIVLRSAEYNFRHSIFSVISRPVKVVRIYHCGSYRPMA